ncbi:MAG: isoprenylcysteine carboxylmethyltransferase family protein [Candidatus Omnitrophota bacterium]
MKKRIRLQGTLIFLVVLAVIFLYKFLFPHSQKEPIDEFLDIAGMGLVLFGFLFRISARGHKEEKSLNSQTLVKDGPYAMIRNPMYFGTFLIGTGIVCILFKLWTLFLFWAVYLLIYIPQIKKETAVLSERFSAEYTTYIADIPKYFPGIRRLMNIRKYVFLKLAWIKKELFSFIMVISAIIIFEAWEDMRQFGRNEFFKEPLELLLIMLFFLIIMAVFIKRDGTCRKHD